jgi:hypothetical protein
MPLAKIRVIKLVALTMYGHLADRGKSLRGHRIEEHLDIQVWDFDAVYQVEDTRALGVDLSTGL